MVYTRKIGIGSHYLSIGLLGAIGDMACGQTTVANSLAGGGRGVGLLGATPPGPTERVVATLAIIFSFATVAAVAPFARMHFPEVSAFIPLYQGALLVIDLITATILYSQFVQSRWAAFLILASAYLFDGLMIVPHTLTFPGLFTASGLLGAGPQTTAWLFLFWHGGFAAFILAYAILREIDGLHIRAVLAALVASIIVVGVLVTGLSMLATVGHDALPTVMRGNDYTLVVRKGISPAVCLLTVCGLAALWSRRNRSILDLWLVVVLATWLCDVLLGAVVGSSRFDLGFYAGRAFGLLSSCFLLVTLLVEVVRLQSELVKSEQAIARIQHFEAIGKLTGGIAHDFNNLLTIVGGAAEMMRRAPDDRSKVARLCESILDAVQRGATVTRQLLTFARQQVSHAETANPNRLLQRFEALLRQAVGANVEIQFDMSLVIDPVRIDPTLFESAVLNLVVNARDAMPHGGRITIRTKNVAVSESSGMEQVPAGDYVTIEISDNGVGMTPEVRAQAVNPFFTTKQFGAGSGMGLSQVYGFVRTFGGFLQIDSELGKGTTVTMYLRKTTNGRHERAAVEILPMHHAGQPSERVLLVEDQPGVLAVTRDALTELGYVVVTATSADEALELLKGDAQIDILFSDIVMPGQMNGAQLAVEAKRARPGIKVLLTSGYAPEVMRAQGVAADMPIVAKPYRAEDLAARFRVVAG